MIFQSVLPPVKYFYLPMIPNVWLPHVKTIHLWVCSTIFDLLSNWSVLNGMLFNEAKSLVIRFPSGFSPPVYFLNNSVITVARSNRDLGVILTSDLSWSAHACASQKKEFNRVPQSIFLMIIHLTTKPG